MEDEKSKEVLNENSEKNDVKQENKENVEIKETENQTKKPESDANTDIKNSTSTTNKRKQPTFNRKNNQQKIKRRRKQREEGAPKMPLTGYVRYMNFRREKVKQDYPDKSSGEHIKIIAAEWNLLTEEQKKPYLEAAEVDKERYNKQMKEYNKQKKAKISNTSPNNSGGSGTNINNGNQNNRSAGVNNSSVNSSILNGRKEGILNNITKPVRRIGDNSIPIFTDEFLEHNKTADLELRTLRKSNIDYEQQNSVLEKHIEVMKFGVEKIDSENTQLLKKKNLLETYLQKLKTKLSQAFSGLSLPTQPNGATMENIDKYMNDLHSMATSSNYGPASLNKAKDIIRKLDLQIQL